MRHKRLLVASVTVILPALALVVSSQAAQEPQQTDVFVSGKDGYHTYRIPSAIVTTKGTLLLFCEGRKASRSDTGDIDLLLKRSTDGGRTFRNQQIVWDDGPNTCGNPCPVVDEDTGRIWLLMTHNPGNTGEHDICAGKGEGTRTVWITHSDDDGESWARPVEMTRDVKAPQWRWYATGPGVGIQLKHGQYKGRLVIPCDYTEMRDDTFVAGSHVIYSDDHGKTWQRGGAVTDMTNECQVIERSDGSLLLNMRWWQSAKTQCRLTAISTDGGITWSKAMRDEALISPACQASLIRLNPSGDEDRPIVLFSNPAHISQRIMMTVRLSLDEGRTWPTAKVLWEGATAYSCLTGLKDGMVGCLYERGDGHPYEKITFARLDLDWLMDREPGGRSEAAPTLKGVDADRVKQIATKLPAEPMGFGVPADNRDAWKPLAKMAGFQAVVAQANQQLDRTLPELPDDLFLDFSRTGNRERWQDVAGQRSTRLHLLALAECLEDKGRFIAAYEQGVRALCYEPTWVMPAHDRSLVNFKGTQIDIDLRSSKVACELALADFLLGDRLSPETRALIREQVARRVLDPYRDMITGKREMNHWVTCTNNWNAVCHANVVGAALWLIESRVDRACFVAAAEKYSDHFLRGFGADGYCSEGVGYWNYGFGHYLLLAEMVHQATGGRVDFLSDEKVRPAARYGANIEIINGVCPPFADCPVNARPASMWMWYVNRRFGLNDARWEQADLPTPRGDLATSMMFVFPNSASDQTVPTRAGAVLPPRHFFEFSGILLCRPGERSSCKLGVALKGGHNAEHHNHNDVGSYVVVVGEQTLLADVGAELYTARTFSPQRYESQILNSYGHPVPIVAGQLQRTGHDARGEIVRTAFTDATDTIVLDMTSAYPVEQLKKLERTFIYSREGAGSLTVTDHVVFSEPRPFGTALVTLSEWEQSAPGVLRIQEGGEAVEVRIDSTVGLFSIDPERIEGDLRTNKPPTRLGINLKQPVTEATVTMAVTPAGSSSPLSE